MLALRRRQTWGWHVAAPCAMRGDRGAGHPKMSPLLKLTTNPFKK